MQPASGSADPSDTLYIDISDGSRQPVRNTLGRDASLRHYVFHDSGCFELRSASGAFTRMPDNRYCEPDYGKAWTFPSSDVMIDYVHNGLMPQIRSEEGAQFGASQFDSLFFADARYSDPSGLVFPGNPGGGRVTEPLSSVWEGAGAFRRVGCYTPQPAVAQNADEYFHRSRLYFLAETWEGKEVVVEIVFAQVRLDEEEVRNPRADTWREMRVNLVNVYGDFPRVRSVEGGVDGRFRDRFVDVEDARQGCGGGGEKWRPALLFPDEARGDDGSPGTAGNLTAPTQPD